MYKTINDYLDNQVKKALGKDFTAFLDNGNYIVRSQIFTNENFVCFNSDDIKLTFDENLKPIKVMVGIRLPDFNSSEAKEYYGNNDANNYEKIVNRVRDELFNETKIKLDVHSNYIKMLHDEPSLSITLFPFFIKQENNQYYVSKGNGEWKPLIEELEVYRIPEAVNKNILKVISLIHAYVNKNEIKVNDSYISYVAFTNLLNKKDLDLKESLALVLRKLKTGLRKDKLIYNQIFSLQQTMDRAIQIEKKDPEQAVTLLDSFLKQ